MKNISALRYICQTLYDINKLFEKPAFEILSTTDHAAGEYVDITNTLYTREPNDIMVIVDENGIIQDFAIKRDSSYSDDEAAIPLMDDAIQSTTLTDPKTTKISQEQLRAGSYQLDRKFATEVIVQELKITKGTVVVRKFIASYEFPVKAIVCRLSEDISIN